MLKHQWAVRNPYDGTPDTLANMKFYNYGQIGIIFTCDISVNPPRWTVGAVYKTKSLNEYIPPKKWCGMMYREVEKIVRRFLDRHGLGEITTRTYKHMKYYDRNLAPWEIETLTKWSKEND